jgi:hypothetical protein
MLSDFFEGYGENGVYPLESDFIDLSTIKGPEIYQFVPLTGLFCDAD